MNLNIAFFTSIVMTIIALSVASERLVEIIKGFIPWLERKNDDKRKEGFRRAFLHCIAVISGVVTAYLASPAIEGILPKTFDYTRSWLALGLLASGGSGFWNVVLSYLGKVKDIKKIELEKM
ncbi:MAG: hypothetical protein ACFFG0_36275 [Candidatus Thorarchaeota archaeon]